MLALLKAIFFLLVEILLTVGYYVVGTIFTVIVAIIRLFWLLKLKKGERDVKH